MLKAVANRSLSYWEAASGLDQKTINSDLAIIRETEIAIVGAGFCGAWLAYFLLKRDPTLKVAIIERDFFNLGASVRNAGFLSCGNISEWLEDSKAFPWKEVVRTLRAVNSPSRAL